MSAYSIAVESVLRQIAVQLCSKQCVQSVDDALTAHSSINGASSALRMFRGDKQLFTTDCCVLYSVEGVHSDIGSKIFVLDDTTAATHRVHAAMRRTIRYAVIVAAPFVDNDGVTSSEIVPQLHTVVDCCPQAAVMSHYKQGMSILTRPSALMSEASDILASIERGTCGCDVEGALSNCCLWLVESMQLIERDFRRALQNSSSGLSIVEAFQKRYTTTLGAMEMLTAPNSVPRRLEAFGNGEGQGFQRWSQRMSQLLLLTEQRRVEATWLAMLAHPLLTMHLAQPRTSQSLQPLLDLVPKICVLLCLVNLSNPSDASADKLLLCDGETSEGLAYVVAHRLAPQISRDLVSKARDLICFETLFSVEAVPDRNEIQGHVMPLCTRPAVQARLHNSIELVTLFASTFRNSAASFESSFPLTADSPRVAISEESDVATAGAIYAANRCTNILGMIAQADAAGCGLMSAEVRCLFQTLHRGATSFSLLDVNEYKNWQLFADTYEKTLVLKYTKEEPVKYVAQLIQTPAVPARSVAPPTFTSAAAPAETSSNNNRVADEERAILSSRVTVLTQELSECRQLLAAMTKQLAQSQQGLREAQELNVVLLLEMQRSNILTNCEQMGSESTIPSRYQQLITSLADSQ